MNESRSQRQVIILDCCFSGAIAQGLTVKDHGSVNLPEQLGGKGRAILTSSTSTQYSFEQEGSDLSIYTRYLVEGMEKGAADHDGDGWISIDELHEYASSKEWSATRVFGLWLRGSGLLSPLHFLSFALCAFFFSLHFWARRASKFF